MKNVKLIVATHKKYQMPKDSLYLPLQVGSEGKKELGYEKDNNGDNISLKNPYFCELTGLYWAWKNLKSDYIGLVHYRRYFTLNNKKMKNEQEKFNKVLNMNETQKILENTDIILPKKRKYYTITKEGKKNLKDMKEEWNIFSAGVNQVVGGVLFGY